MKVKVAIAEDNHRLALAFREKLELNSNISVEFMAPNGKALIQELEKGRDVNLILMDINMPVMDGIEATRLVRKQWPDSKILMSTVFDDEEHIIKAIMAGANGYLLKDETPDKIHAAINDVMEGGVPMSSSIARKTLEIMKNNMPKIEAVSTAEDFDLTKREIEILEVLSMGLSYELIGEKLFISSGTVRKHIENIYRKLQVHNKVEAIQKATQHRII